MYGNYNLRFQSDFRICGINKVFYGQNSISYFWTFDMELSSTYLRNICDFDLFKTTKRKFIVACVKATWAILVLLMRQVNYTR